MTEQTEHCVLVLDEESGHEAIYIGAELVHSCDTLYSGDIALYLEGKTVQVSQVVVQMPENMHWPKQFERLMPWVI